MSDSDSDSCSLSDGILTDDQIEVSQVAQTVSAQNIKLKNQLNELQERYSELQDRHTEEVSQLEATITELNNKCEEQNILAQKTVESCKSHIDSSQVEILSMQARLEQAEYEIESLLKAVSRKTGVKVTNADAAVAAISDSGSSVFTEISRKYGTSVRSINDLYEFINGIMKIPCESSQTLDEKDYKLLYEQSELENERLREQHLIPKPVERAEKSRITELELENRALKEQLLNLKLTQAEEEVLPQQQMKEEVNLDYELHITEYETKIRELELKLSEARRQPERGDSISQESDDACLEDQVQESIAFSELLNTSEEQIETIEALSGQKYALQDIIKSLLKALELAENQIKEMMEEKSELIEELEQSRKEFEEERNKESEFWEILIDRIIDTLPRDCETHEDLVRDEQILAIISDLIDRLEAQDIPKEKEPPRNREALLLSQLENALSYIRYLVALRREETGEPVLDESEKARITSEVARIDRLISKEHIDLPHVKSPSFFCEESPDEQLSVVTEFMEERGDESPFRELYDLFAAVVDVNALLHMRNRDLVEQITTKSRRKMENLTEMCDKQSEKIASVVATLKEIGEHGDDDDDVVTLANNVAHEFNKLVSENNANIETIHSLNEKQAHFEEQQMMMQSEKDKKVIEKLKRKVKKLNQELINERNDRDEMVTKAHNQLDEAIFALSEAKETKKALAACEAKVEKMQANKERLAQLESQLTAFDQERATLDATIVMLKSENERLTTQNTLLTETISNLRSSAKAQAEKYAAVKAENSTLKKQNTVTIQDIRARNESLHQEYEKRLADLESTLAAKSEDLERSISDRKKLRTAAAENKVTIAKLKLTEKVLTAKLAQATEQSHVKTQTLESQYNASITALKTELESEIIDLRETMSKSLDSLIFSVESTFGVTLNSRSKKSLQNFAATFDFLLQEHTIRDAIAIRRTLKIREGISINTVIDSYKNDLDNRDAQVAKLEEELSSLRKEIESLKAKCKEMEPSHRKNTEWENWSKQMIRITDNYIPPMTPEDARFTLEEVILASISSDSLRKKLETLRKTKKFLTSSNAGAAYTQSDRQKPTIRSLTLIFMFANRLRSSV